MMLLWSIMLGLGLLVVSQIMNRAGVPEAQMGQAYHLAIGLGIILGVLGLGLTPYLMSQAMPKIVIVGSSQLLIWVLSIDITMRIMWPKTPIIIVRKEDREDNAA